MGMGATSPGFGSLQDPYSTSLPSSGGYWIAAHENQGGAGGAPNGRGLVSVGAAGAGGNGMYWDEKEEKRRRKEEKKKALKAAWGIDEREYTVVSWVWSGIRSE